LEDVSVLLRARVSLLDRPGALLAVARAVADLGGNIVDIEILATTEGRVVDDLVVEMPTQDLDALTAQLATSGAQVLSLRRTVLLSGQRPDLDLLHRISTGPADALATMVSVAPPIWSADWAMAVLPAEPEVAVRSSPGAPRPVPNGLPVPLGALPRRAGVTGSNGQHFEVVGVHWDPYVLYLGRLDGPTFLQVELIQLRRVVDLALALIGAASPKA
jgi:predicted amino acid-binding ACT domain protein